MRVRGLVSAGASAIFAVLGGLFYLALTCVTGGFAYFALSSAQALRMERAGDLTALGVTAFGILFLTRPLILTNLSGGSLKNLLHLPIRRGELLAYSLLTGVVTPLILESPVWIGAALGAASHPTLALVTLPLALLVHLTLLFGAHSMSLLAVVIARRTWVSDLARVFAFSLFFLPSLLNYRATREFLRPFIEPLAQISPLGWGARATVYAGAGDVRAAIVYAVPAILFVGFIAFVSMTLLKRILAGDGADRVDRRTAEPRRARMLLPGALGALIETQLRTQLRTPAARMALLMPTLMMGFFALSLSRPGAIANPFAMVVFLSLVGGNVFLSIGRGVALILGTPVSRSSMLLASDVASFIFRIPPLLAIIAVTAWRGGAGSALSMVALVFTLVPVGMGVQHFVSILRPVTIPQDRLNPFAQRSDARQAGSGLVSLVATLATGLLASPFLFLLWLSGRVAEGEYESWLLALACLGAAAMYAVLLTIAERLFVKRELQVLEVLLDDSPA